MLESRLPIRTVCRHLPLLASQILTVLSYDADARRLESCEKTTERTEPLWPSSVCMHLPLLASQILTILSYDADARMSDGALFRYKHLYALQGKLFDHFSSGTSCSFSFVLSSRPAAQSLNDFPCHLREVFALVPSEAWLWHFVSPLVASAIVLASYPPGSHGKRFTSNAKGHAKSSVVYPATWIVEKCFEPATKMVIAETIVQSDARNALFKAIKERLAEQYQEMTTNPTKTAVVLYQDRLTGLNSYFNRLRSHKTCLCCLLRAPKKVLACGHTLCNICVSTLGVRSLEDKYTFILNRCPLCGTPCDYTEF